MSTPDPRPPSLCPSTCHVGPDAGAPCSLAAGHLGYHVAHLSHGVRASWPDRPALPRLPFDVAAARELARSATPSLGGTAMTLRAALLAACDALDAPAPPVDPADDSCPACGTVLPHLFACIGRPA